MSKYTEAEVQNAFNVLKQTMADAVDTEEVEDVIAAFDGEAAEYIKIYFGADTKPAKKIIDLSPLLNSGIDCEFSDDFEDWHIGGLIGIHTSSHNKRQFYEDYLETNWGHCRPRMNHTMFHNGGECPLPEGFEVQLSYCKGVACNTSDYTSKRWNDVGNNADIIGYKILGLADGYAYPWEQTE